MTTPSDVPFPRLRSWWSDGIDTISLTDPEVRRLVARFTDTDVEELTELGGWMSRNLRLTARDGRDLVLRIHPRAMSRARLLAIHRVRRRLDADGLLVPVPVESDGTTVFRCGRRLAELEPYLPHRRLPPGPDAHAWLFDAMGTVHRALRRMEHTERIDVPRPMEAHFAPPATLRRWFSPARPTLNCEPTAVADELRTIIERLRTRWPAPGVLPTQLVHGDVKLPNLGVGPDDGLVVLDFGHMTRRPRIHDLAFTFTHTLVYPEGTLPDDGHEPATPETFDWSSVSPLIERYEQAMGERLTDDERRALPHYIATVMLYWPASCWFATNPAENLLENGPLIHFSRWLLDHPDSLPSPR